MVSEGFVLESYSIIIAGTLRQAFQSSQEAGNR
jgi:hypothetical protein